MRIASLTRLCVPVLACCAVALVAAEDALAKQGRRFGIEGKVVGYDEANKVLTVMVMETKVQGRSLSGNTVGGNAPGDVKRGREMDFAVEPTGSVLRRTVIKAMTGGGLDTTGTPEGFKKALAAVPDDRAVVMSLEANPDGGPDAPRYKILMIQIQYTEEELEERWRRVTVDEGEE